MSVPLSPRALLTLDDAWAFAHPETPDDLPDDEDAFVRLINAASNHLQLVHRREVVAANAVRTGDPVTGPVTVAAVSRDYDAEDISTLGELPIGDLAQLNSIQIDGAALDLTPVVALPRNRVEWKPIERLRLRRLGWCGWTGPTVHPWSTVTVTGVWGFPEIPEALKEACRETVKFWSDRGTTTFSEIYISEEGAPAGGSSSSRRALPQSAYETALLFRRGVRAASVRIS